MVLDSMSMLKIIWTKNNLAELIKQSLIYSRSQRYALWELSTVITINGYVTHVCSPHFVWFQSANLVRYSSYVESSLIPTANLMLNYILKPIHHESFYAGKRFMPKVRANELRVYCHLQKSWRWCVFRIKSAMLMNNFVSHISMKTQWINMIPEWNIIHFLLSRPPRFQNKIWTAQSKSAFLHCISHCTQNELM